MRRLRFSAFLFVPLIIIGCQESTETPVHRTVHVPDWNYVSGKYFFLIDPNDPNSQTGSVTSIHLYLDDKDVRNNVELGAQPARAWLDPRTKTPPNTTGEFHLLKEWQDYTVQNDLNFSFPRIELTTSLWPNQSLAVAYIQTVGAVSETVGTWTYSPPPDTLDLKMLRPSDEEWGPNDLKDSPWAPVRYLEIKNVYSLGVQNIDPASFTLDVVRDIAGPNGQNPNYMDNEFGRRTPLLQVLGLDQVKNGDPHNRTPDGWIDPEYVDLVYGLIFVPDLRPFDPDIADIDGTTVRLRSWPREFGEERPDTLGWYKQPGSGLAVMSPLSRRSIEVIPDLYDLKYTKLTQTSLQHHLYTMVVTLSLY